MSARIVPQQGPSDEMTDWPGSPLSTLHHAAADTLPIKTEAFAKDGRYVVRFELPGVDPEADIDVSVQGQDLTVHAERRASEAGSYHSEFRYGLFCSHVTLPASVDSSDVTATCENGVLDVSVGMRGTHEPRKIAVTSGADRR
jgi:HSP20 family molecular chaperone IbpA